MTCGCLGLGAEGEFGRGVDEFGRLAPGETGGAEGHEDHEAVAFGVRDVVANGLVEHREGRALDEASECARLDVGAQLACGHALLDDRQHSTTHRFEPFGHDFSPWSADRELGRHAHVLDLAPEASTHQGECYPRVGVADGSERGGHPGDTAIIQLGDELVAGAEVAVDRAT